jgi:hypothetical protein
MTAPARPKEGNMHAPSTIAPSTIPAAHWHRYGPVEIAIVGPDPDITSTYGRLYGGDTVYQQCPTGETEWDPQAGPCPQYDWHVVAVYGDVAVAADRIDRDDPAGPLLDAGCTLCWAELEAFQLADAAMGDPYP